MAGFVLVKTCFYNKNDSSCMGMASFSMPQLVLGRDWKYFNFFVLSLKGDNVTAQ